MLEWMFMVFFVSNLNGMADSHRSGFPERDIEQVNIYLYFLLMCEY